MQIEKCKMKGRMLEIKKRIKEKRRNDNMVTEEIKPGDIMAEESWEEGWKEEDWEIVEIYEALLDHFTEVDKLYCLTVPKIQV